MGGVKKGIRRLCAPWRNYHRVSIYLFVYLSIYFSHNIFFTPRQQNSSSHPYPWTPAPLQAPSIPVPQNFNVVAREGEYTDVQINLQPFLPKEYLQYLKSIISKVISKVKIYLSS